MNLSGEEKRIRQLFHELSRDELERAPEFAVLVAANSLRLRSRNRSRLLRFATALLVLFAVVMTALMVEPSRPPGPDTPLQSLAPEPEKTNRAEPLPPGATQDALPGRRGAKMRRHRRSPDRLTVAMRSLFAWQSPTASLLTAPGDELLNSLPRLGESLQTIKSYSPDQFN